MAPEPSSTVRNTADGEEAHQGHGGGTRIQDLARKPVCRSTRRCRERAGPKGLASTSALALDPRSVEAQSWLAAALAGRFLANMTDTSEADVLRAESLVQHALGYFWPVLRSQTCSSWSLLQEIMRRCSDSERKLGHLPFTPDLSNSSIILGVSFSRLSVYDRSGRRVTS